MAGYFVIYPDTRRRVIQVEHYTNAGVLDCVLTGETPAALYGTIIERSLIGRLDHAAYLGRELARAERSGRGPSSGSPSKGSASWSVCCSWSWLFRWSSSDDHDDD